MMVRVRSASPVTGLKRLLRSQKQPASSQRPPSCSTPIERLLPHVLYDIGHCVDSRDVLHLSLCSRQLRAALTPLLYSTVELKTNKHCKSSLLALSKNPDATQHIRRLIVHPNSLQWTEPGDELDEDGIASLLAAIASAGHLRALDAFEWGGIEMPHDAMWLALRKSCRSLRRISTTIGEAPLSASSPLWDFSDLRQVALNVKCHSLDWLAEGLPKTEKLPRKFWAMLLERCPRLEDLTIGGAAPAPRIFDVRHVTAGRWPRLRSISLGGMVLISSGGETQQQRKDDEAFQSFFALHTSLRKITLQHAEGSAHVPSVFSFSQPQPQSPQLPPQLRYPLPHLESFAGPLRLARSLPSYTRMKTLRRLTLTALHHSASSFPPTCAVLQEEFGALRELGVWVDLSFGQQVSSASRVGAGSAASMAVMGRRSAERERGERGVGERGRVDDMLMLRALLAACPRLMHLDLACFTRPTFSLREFSRTLQSSAPLLESFTLVKMHKSADDAEFAGASGTSSKAAVRLAAENPKLRWFKICTTLDAWLNPREGRVKVLGVYEVVRSVVVGAGMAGGVGVGQSADLSSSRESVMSGSAHGHGPHSAPASITHFSFSSGQPPAATMTAATTTTMLHAHEYGQRNLTGRMYSRHLVIPLTPKEHRDGAPPSSFPHSMTQSVYASLSRVGSVTSTVNSHQSHQSYSHSQSYHHPHSRPQSYTGHSAAASEESHDCGHGHQLHHHQSLHFEIPAPHRQQQQDQQAPVEVEAKSTLFRWGSRSKGHRRGTSFGSASNSVSPSAWVSGSGSGSASGSGSRSRRASLSNVVSGIAHALGARMKHGDSGADRERRMSVVSSCHGSTSTSAGSGTASGVSRSASGSSGGASSGSSSAAAGSPVVPTGPARPRGSTSTEDGFVLV